MPPISFFAYLLKAIKSERMVYLEYNENYIKQTFRNRAYIATKTGLQTLSIPIESNDGIKTKTKDIIISEHGNWRSQHIHAIQTSYGTCPYFEYYADEIFEVIRNTDNSLWSINKSLIDIIIKDLGIDITFNYTQNFCIDDDSIEDYRFIINPKKQLIELDVSNIKYYDTIGSRQEVWIQKLSIIDLLFNMGPESILVLQNTIL